MKRYLRSSFSTLRGGLALASVLALSLTGCGGGGGGGNNSSSTTPATSGVVIEGDPGSAITIPSDPTTIVGKNAVLDLSQTASFENNKLTFHFFLKDEDGKGISLTKNNCQFRAYVSKLTDNTTDEDPGLGWHQVGQDSASFNRDTKLAELNTLHGLLTVIDGSTGEYSYTYADDGKTGSHAYDPGGIAAAYADVNNTIRLRATLVTSCQYVDENVKAYVTVNPVNASYDFKPGAAGTELTNSEAEIVNSAACFTCHGSSLANADHGSYTEVKTCNQCHALNSYVSDQNADLAPFVHSIHYHKPSQANGGGAYQTGDPQDAKTGHDFSEVTYPQNIWNCAKCHADGTAVDKATADGKDGPVAADSDLAYTNPTRRACGSCHSDVNFVWDDSTTTGKNHPGGQQKDDSLCIACHPATGNITAYSFPVKTVHDLGPLGDDPSVQPEFSVDITPDTPARGYYIAGETPTVTVTLTSIDGGADVDYTAGRDTTAGDRNGVLTRADMFVYGPRSHAVPVLTPGSTTDSPTDPPTQGVSLLGHGDATGFHYTLQAIPATLAPGTYLVRVGVADSGDVNSSSEPNPAPRTASTKVIHFQIGTDTEEPKVSGNGCLNCHGDTAMHFQPGSYGTHTSPFDTDYCLACHDYSGNHADYIGNRVHAIHNETFSGDAYVSSSTPYGRVWTEVTFPQQANNCSICHTNSDALVPVWQTTEPLACGGCHGTNPDAVAAAKTYIADNGITGNEAGEITTKARNEAIAASHMLIMMGHSGGNQKDFVTYGSKPVPGCLVCHGPGQPQDLYQLMGLAKFGIPDNQ